MASVTKVKPKQVALYLIIAFLIVSVWKDPQLSADYAGEFLGQVGHFLLALYRKLSQFIEGIAN